MQVLLVGKKYSRMVGIWTMDLNVLVRTREGGGTP